MQLKDACLQPSSLETKSFCPRESFSLTSPRFVFAGPLPSSSKPAKRMGSRRAEHIAGVLTDKTRWLILNSPSNPAGAVIDEVALAAIAVVLKQHPGVLVFSDEIYESIYFDGRRLCNIVNVAPDFSDRTMILNGISKAYAMTGWRIRYLAGPAPLIAAISQVTATSTFTASSIAQAAAVEALDGPQDSLAIQNAAYRLRRDLLLSSINRIPGELRGTRRRVLFICQLLACSG